MRTEIQWIRCQAACQKWLVHKHSASEIQNHGFWTKSYDSPQNPKIVTRSVFFFAEPNKKKCEQRFIWSVDKTLSSLSKTCSLAKHQWNSKPWTLEKNFTQVSSGLTTPGAHSDTNDLDLQRRAFGALCRVPKCARKYSETWFGRSRLSMFTRLLCLLGYYVRSVDHGHCQSDTFSLSFVLVKMYFV